MVCFIAFLNFNFKYHGKLSNNKSCSGELLPDLSSNDSISNNIYAINCISKLFENYGFYLNKKLKLLCIKINKN